MRAARLACLAASLAVLLAAPGAEGAAPGKAAAPAASAGPKGGKAGARAHPDVGGDQDCAGCHEQATPAAWRAWEAGPHGLSLVKCQVCHGSTGKDFTMRPAPERCRGCHGAELDSIAPLIQKGVGCFACHAPHTLAASPHRAAAK
jgi:hypothetical protein